MSKTDSRERCVLLFFEAEQKELEVNKVVNTKEMYEVFAVANIVGGTIVVPHTRRAAEYWEALVEN